MKKIGILGLMISLFVVFALSSCGKDDEPKKEDVKEVTHIGADYFLSTTFEEEYTFDYLISFDTADKLRFQTIMVRPDTEDDKGIKTKSIYHYNYTYDKATKEIKLTKVLSAFEIVNDRESEKEDDTEDATNLMKSNTFQFDEKFEHLTLKGGETTLVLKRR